MAEELSARWKVTYLGIHIKGLGTSLRVEWLPSITLWFYP